MPMPLVRDLSWSNLKTAASRLGSQNKQQAGTDSDGASTPGNSADVSTPGEQTIAGSSGESSKVNLGTAPGSTPIATAGSRGERSTSGSAGSRLAVPGSDSQASFGAASLASIQSFASSTSSQQQQPPQPRTTLALLRVQVVRASNLTPKDRNGKADPFVSVTIPGLANLPGRPGSGGKTLDGQAQEAYRRQTAVIPKTLEPEWKDEVWDFEVTNEWFGPGGWQEAEAAIEAEDDDEEALDTSTAKDDQNVAPQLATIRLDPEAAAQASSLPPDQAANALVAGATLSVEAKDKRPTSRRMLSATASKVLSSSAKGMKMLPKGAAAGARAVARGAPRPMRLRRNGGSGGASSRLRGPAAGLVSNLEIVVWDKDFARREYMGEASWPVWEWCRGKRKVEWEKSSPVKGTSSEAEEAVWLSLVSSRQNAKVSGQVQIRLGFVPVAGSPVKSLDRLYRSLVASAVGAGSRVDGAVKTIHLAHQSGEMHPALQPGVPIANDEEIRAGIRAIPASQSVGTAEQFFADDGFSSDEEEQEELLDSESEEDENDDSDFSESETDTDDLLSAGDDGYSSSLTATEGESDADILTRHRQRVRQVTPESQRGTPGLDSMAKPSFVNASSADSPSSDAGLTPDSSLEASAAAPRNRRKLFKGLVRRRTGEVQTSGEVTPAEPLDASIAAAQGKTQTRKKPRKLKGTGKKDGETREERKLRKMRRRLARRERNREDRERKQEAAAAKADYSFKSSGDIIGIVMMEVKGAKDLPRWKNSMRTGFDMDPFAIVAFGQKIFRTRVLRHTLNPVWDEKLLFHVRQHEDNFVVKMSIYDWDKLTANDHVGSCELPLAALVDAAPKPKPGTSLYSYAEDGLHEMQTFELPLNRVEKDEDVKYGESSPKLTIQAKFTPYAALRQRFWRQLCQQFDTNDSASLSLLELTSMLDSLGSTLTPETIASFFTRFDKSAESDEISIDEAIIALEAETQKSFRDKRRTTGSGTATAASTVSEQTSSYDQAVPANQDVAGRPTMDVSGPKAPTPAIHVEPEEMDSAEGSVGSSNPVPTTALEPAKEDSEASIKPVQLERPRPGERGLSMSSTSGGDETPEDSMVERVILLKSCPLCHMPRLSKKGDGDVVTHLAVCASQDWRRVDSMVVRNFVTASQAHRKWLNKIVITATQGRYKLGGNSANIIVQDRETGELLEEKMQVYVRLGIRLLYQGARSRMEGARVRRMLKNMSVKQGKKYDSPSSAREIPGFITFHNLNVNEIRDPLDSFKTFNEFFYRKLKADARPVSEPNNPARLVSAADCRLMVFPSIDQAATIWVKGREFSVERLLGDALKSSLGSKEEVDEYRNGSLCIFRLAPQDYHRFHCPADATVGKPHPIEGAYYTVNPMAIRSAIDIYGENVRVIVPFSSSKFGTFFAVNVGAMMVGSVKITVKEGDEVKRGDEMGYYAFGGSTTILVFKRGVMTWDEDIVANSNASIETLVKQGTGIGRATASIGSGSGKAAGSQEEDDDE